MGTQNMNRIEADLLRWKEKEERFSKLFSFEMSSNKALMREKLRYYEGISLKYRGTAEPSERFTRKMLRQEIRHLERKLHPNLSIRLIRRLVVNPIRYLLAMRSFKIAKKAKVQSLFTETKRFGMEKQFSRAARMMEQGLDDFSLTSNQYIRQNERIENILSFKDNKAVSLKAVLHDDASGIAKQHTFNLKDYPEIGVQESYNLLAGRAVHNDGKWLVLDQNDRDTKGNCKIQTIPKDSGFLERTLEGLPFKELLLDSTKKKVIAELEKGNRVGLTLEKGGKQKQIYIEANPNFDSIVVRDQNMLKTTMPEVLGKKQGQQTKAEQNQQSSKRSRIRIVN